MSDRYATITFSQTVAAGDYVQFGVSIPQNFVNVSKIRVVPSVASAPTEFFIFKDSTFANADLVYRTVEFEGPLIDPVLSDGVLIVEKNEGHVCAYEDKQESLQLYIKIKNNHTTSVTYTGAILVDTTVAGGDGQVLAVPEGLDVRAFAVNLDITSGVIARKNAATIVEAEFRAKFIPTTDLQQPYYDLRTAAEGGTFAHNGTTALVITGIDATMDGAQYIWTSASEGIWYYAWRLRNSVGWSNWSDGNITPRRVYHYVATRSTTDVDDGPPEDWDVYLEDGPMSNTVVVRATRPKINGDLILWMVVQVKDGDTGVWTSLLDGPDSGNIRLDGRANHYSLSATRNVIADTDNAGWGTAANGDLVFLDVRGAGNWNEQHCQWATVRLTSGQFLYINGFFRPVTGSSDYRIVIVKPPWSWTTGGYLGASPQHGIWPYRKEDENLFLGDTGTTEFVTTPISIPAGVTNPEARVWFENAYSRADNNLTHSSGRVGFPTARLFTSFKDTRYFVPIFGNTEFVTVSISQTDGRVTINAPAPRPTAISQAGSAYGVKFRGKIFPDLAGVLKIRAKWQNVSIPQWSGSIYGINNEGTSLLLAAGYDWSHSYQFFPWSMLWGNFRDEATINFMSAQISGGETITAPGRSGSLPTWANYLQVPRPAPGYDLEMKIGWTISLGNPDHMITTAEYQLNGGGWVALPGITGGYFGKYSNQVLQGITPIIGAIEFYQVAGQLLSSWSAKLTEFEVIQGVIVQNRLQQGGVSG